MKAIKVKIYPKKTQADLLEKHFGCCRFIYNFGLELKTKTYNETKKSISVYQIQKDLPSLKEKNPWLAEVNSQSLQQSLKDLDSAFSRFFKKDSSFPRFKSKKNAKKSFRVPQHFKLSKDKPYIKLPKIGWIRFKDKFNVPSKVDFRNITISREGTEYFAAICYDENKAASKQQPVKANRTVGIDLGLSTFATLSDGTKIENPRHFKKHEDALAEEQRKFSAVKNQEGRKYRKQKEKVQKIHKKIRNVRKDFLHKVTTSLVKNQDWTSYAIEDLAVKNMMQNHCLAQAIGDVGWRMWRQMMEYKTKDTGKNLLVIGRFDASSKTCTCGVKNENLTLADRKWTCTSCGKTHNRDELAANNIKTFAIIQSGQRLYGS